MEHDKIEKTPDDKIREFKRLNRGNFPKGEVKMYWKDWEEVKAYCEDFFSCLLDIEDDGSFRIMGVNHYKQKTWKKK